MDAHVIMWLYISTGHKHCECASCRISFIHQNRIGENGQQSKTKQK